MTLLALPTSIGKVLKLLFFQVSLWKAFLRDILSHSMHVNTSYMLIESNDTAAYAVLYMVFVMADMGTVKPGDTSTSL